MTAVSAETRQKISKTKLGERNPQWKGDKAGYHALHWWVNRRLHKPQLCQMCHRKPPHDLANITDMYTRDFTNWLYLCRSCHMGFDGRLIARDRKGKVGIAVWQFHA